MPRRNMPRNTRHITQDRLAPLTVKVTEEITHALALYGEGHTLREVARLTGRSVPWVHTKIIEAMAAIPLQTAERLREIEVAKLDESEQLTLMIRERQHPKFVGQVLATVPVFNEDGSPKMVPKLDPRTGHPLEDPDTGKPLLEQAHAYVEDAGAVLACDEHLLKIRKRRAELLGLDMPIKTSLTDLSGNPLLPSQAPFQFNIVFKASDHGSSEEKVIEGTARPAPTRTKVRRRDDQRKGAPKVRRAEPA